MSEFIDRLIEEAARVGFVQVLRTHPELTVEQLRRLCERAGAAKDDLHRISLRQLALPPRQWSDAEWQQEILAYFSRHPDQERPAVFFERHFGIPRQRAQRLVRQLAETGQLERRGERAFTTRYSLRLVDRDLGGSPIGGDHGRACQSTRAA
ncbi:MAG: hypothetical protein HC927_03030 [Deltaproteobacteria bacterium]|nr:hypothetical protein [Deltaproteobacteria bacterium]